ncbi:MAG TPA: MotE family protein [Bacillales bacterium]|nr:MotE family protein [Bacillales bacterium]
MEKEVEENQSRKGKSFQWYLYVVFIPLAFAILVAVIVSFIAGINIIDTAKDFGKKIPIVGSLVQINQANSSKSNDKSVIELQGQIKDREEKISQLETQISDKNKEIQKAELEQKRLQKEIDDVVSSQTEGKRALKDIIKTYETMSAKKAAPIITQMNDEEALKILSSIKADSLAAIMENMNAKAAAKFTQLLTNATDINNE